MNRDWLCVFEALSRVFTDGAYSNMAIGEALLHHKGCKESFVRNYAKGVLRDTIRLDYLIDRLASKGIDKVRRRPLIILRMGIFAIDSLNSVPDHAAVSEAVNLAAKVSKGSEGFINGVLRSYIRQRQELTIPEDRPDIKLSVSKSIFSLLIDQYGNDAENILRAMNEPSKTVIRVNTLRAGRSEVIDKLTKLGIEAEASDETPNAVIATGSGIISSELFKEGLISVQSLSSMLAIEALSPEPGSRALDMCASPGGKSAYMAELMEDKGEIVACDIHDHRLELVDATSRRLGVDSVKTRLSDGTVYEPEFSEKFDYVICDVPCSGLGVISSKPEIKFRSNPAEYDELIEIQKSILRNAILYAKEGGRIEYSTCTLNKNENERVIEELLGSPEGSFLKLLEMKTLMPYNCKVGFFYTILEKN